MDAVDLFQLVGKLQEVRWVSRSGKHIARIDRTDGSLVHISIELRFCGTWIPDKPLDRMEFLSAYKLTRDR